MSESASKAVFLSYASQDAEAARRICDSLRAMGVEVWFDKNELVGGDAWDAKIRKQIAECALFVPIISANTQARLEGYFRLEWKLAAQRTHAMADEKAFLLPVVADDTHDGEARVPAEFKAVQWTRLASGEASPAFCGCVRKLLADEVAQASAPAGSPKVVGTPALLQSAVAAKSIAILAFANLSHDPENEYFSDGISEELLNVLSKVPGLRVAARTSAFHFKGKNLPIRQIAQELGVAHVVEGSVRKMGNRVRITAKLIKASDGFQVWASDNLDRELKDIFAVQDEIAGLIAANLQLKLSESSQSPRTVNPEASRRVLEGRHFVALRSDESFAQAERIFTEAAEIDPQFALAHAGVAEVATLRGLYLLTDGRGPVNQEFGRARAAAHRAMELDVALAEPHAALGLLHFMERRWQESEQHFHEAFRLNPNYATAYHWHGLLLGVTGEFDRALTQLERAIQLDPLAHSALFTYGNLLFAAGRPQESLALCDRGIAVQGETLFYHGMRAVVLAELGRSEEALLAARRVRQGRASQRHWWADGDAIFVLARNGARAEADEYLQEARARLPARSHLLGYALCSLGQFEEGLPLLESVEPMCQTRLYYAPWARSLQGSPEFGRLFEKFDSASEYAAARETLARLKEEQEAKK